MKRKPNTVSQEPLLLPVCDTSGKLTEGLTFFKLKGGTLH